LAEFADINPGNMTAPRWFYQSNGISPQKNASKCPALCSNRYQCLPGQL